MIFKDGILKDKVALVTGAGSGIGKGIALAFAQLGAHVVLLGRNLEKLESTSAQIQALGRQSFVVQADIRVPEQVEEAVRKSVEKFKKIDILVNNAAGNFLARAEELSVNGWKAVTGIVLDGTFYCSQAVGRQMIRQKSGSIVNIVATYAWTGNPYTVHSACAKAGVVAMTQTLAVEWAKHGIRVNAVAPGPIQTEGASSRLWMGHEKKMAEQIPAGRFGTVDEIAQAVVYLVSDAAAYITGEVTVVDGGDWLGKSDFPEELIDQLKEAAKKK
ncbi:MAG: SDR family oxidoreductase [bacterium]